jgi:hypothetical protein
MARPATEDIMAKKPTFQDLQLTLFTFEPLPTFSSFTVDSNGAWAERYSPHHETFNTAGQLTDKEFKELNKLYAKVEKNMLSEPLFNVTDIDADGFNAAMFGVRSNTHAGFNPIVDDGFGAPYYNYDPKVVDPLMDYLLSLDAKYGYPLVI